MRPAVARRLSLLGVALAVVAAALAFGVVPFRDWLDQRQVNDELRARVEAVEVVNQAYEQRIDALNTDEEIERRARRDFNLVHPDEEAYAVVPPPVPPHRVPGIWPFDR